MTKQSSLPFQIGDRVMIKDSSDAYASEITYASDISMNTIYTVIDCYVTANGRTLVSFNDDSGMTRLRLAEYYTKPYVDNNKDKKSWGVF